MCFWILMDVLVQYWNVLRLSVTTAMDIGITCALFHNKAQFSLLHIQVPLSFPLVWVGCSANHLHSLIPTLGCLSTSEKRKCFFATILVQRRMGGCDENVYFIYCILLRDTCTFETLVCHPLRFSWWARHKQVQIHQIGWYQISIGTIFENNQTTNRKIKQTRINPGTRYRRGPR